MIATPGTFVLFHFNVVTILCFFFELDFCMHFILTDEKQDIDKSFLIISLWENWFEKWEVNKVGKIIDLMTEEKNIPSAWLRHHHVSTQYFTSC